MTREITPPVPTDTSGDGRVDLQVPVHGMTCAGCAKSMRRGPSRLPTGAPGR